ncbi:DUF3658 domain-containing protein [Gallaecimonas sp. GXIMD4217]|uniref:DUF3658 domain-containing protein n=1 Tax=Gallaecimonas sp. GXIMD4217 TaxID=3131927 RepID=UPI00311B3F79
MTTLHLVSGGAAAGCVLAMVAGDEQAEVVALDDFLTLGPLKGLDTAQGLAARRAYFAALHGETDRPQTHCGLQALEEIAGTKEQVVLWCSDDGNEQLLLRAACQYLAQERLRVVNVSELAPHRPRAVADCSPEQLAAMQPLGQALSEQEYRHLRRDWQRLLHTKGKLRLYRNGAVEEVPEDHFDPLLLATCSGNFINATRVVGVLLGLCQVKLGEAFLHQRLLRLAEQGAVELQGPSHSLRLMQVRLGKWAA